MKKHSLFQFWVGSARQLCIGVVVIALALAQAASAASPTQEQPLSPSGGGLPPANLAPWFRLVIDGAGSQIRGYFASVALDEGTQTPYISHVDEGEGWLMLAHPVSAGGNCGPRNSWLCEVVDGDGLNGHRDAEVGLSSSLAFFRFSETAYQVGITYMDSTNDELRYAQLSCTGSSCTWTYETIDEKPNIPSTSLKFDSTGTPHVAYHDRALEQPGDFISLAYATQMTGTWSTIMVDQIAYPSSTGEMPSLAFNENDVPYIAYFSYEEGALKLAYPTGLPGNCGPSADWQCDTIDGDLSHPVGHSPSLHVENPPMPNKPEGPSGGNQITSIAYYDQTSDKLKYATTKAGEPNCGPLFEGSPYWQCDEIADMGGVLPMQEIALEVDILGYPVIAYTNGSSTQWDASLNIARPAQALGTLGNCGPLSSTPLPLLTWKCSTLEGTPLGDPGADFYSHVSMALNADGMGYIAYHKTEQDGSGESVGMLKLAYQQFGTYLPLLAK